MAQARIGIVIRTKDRPLFVARALRCVLTQTCRDWSVVLVNDGGDTSVLQRAIAADDLTAPFADGRMRVLTHAQSVGRSEAFNRAAAMLDTEFVCCLDDDDTWEPEFLERLVAFHDATRSLAPDLGGVAALVTAVREDIVTEDGVERIEILGTEDLPHAFKRTDFFLNPIAYATYRHDLYPVQWMLNRQAVLDAGGFPPAFNVMEDRAFMTRFLQNRRLAILDKPLAFHHRRVRRTGDTAQSVAMNTLDNPSYDWRLFSDLAKIEITSPPGAAGSQPVSTETAGDLIRAASATIIKELNDETSALWHKLNGEAMSLRARIDGFEARLGATAPMQDIDTPDTARVWSLWDRIGETDIGYVLAVQTAFLDRLTISMPEDQPGLLLHASPAQERMVLQVPRTLDFAALELSLAGLGDRGGGLRCEAILSATEGYLFQTGLSLALRDRLGRKSHAFDDVHVHSCPPGGSIKITRDFPAAQLLRSETPKLSIVLPRQAVNFRLHLRDLVVSRI
jgi:glycosyltransferase involved in cell wall biosynthesis